MPFQTKNHKTPTRGKGSKLSQRMILFIDHYMVHFVGYKAVLEAGYKTKNADLYATRLLNHPLVSAEIDRRNRDRREKMELTAEYVIQKLIKIVEDTDKDNPQAALRGLELLGKHLGMYKERQEITGKDGGPIEHDQRIREDNAALESAIARLAPTPGTGTVVKLPFTRAKS